MFHLGFVRPQNFLPLGFKISRVFFVAYLKRDSRWALLSNGFLLATRLCRTDLWGAWDIVGTCPQWPVFARKACSSFKVDIGSWWLLWSISSLLGHSVWRDSLILARSWCYHMPSTSSWLSWLHKKGYSRPWKYSYTHPLICAFPQNNPGSLLKLLGVHGWVFVLKFTTQQRKPTGTADFILK